MPKPVTWIFSEADARAAAYQIKQRTRGWNNPFMVFVDDKRVIVNREPLNDPRHELAGVYEYPFNRDQLVDDILEARWAQRSRLYSESKEVLRESA